MRTQSDCSAAFIALFHRDGTDLPKTCFRRISKVAQPNLPSLKFKHGTKNGPLMALRNSTEGVTIEGD